MIGAAGGRSGTTGMGALQLVDQLVDRRSCIVQCGHRETTDGGQTITTLPTAPRRAPPRRAVLGCPACCSSAEPYRRPRRTAPTTGLPPPGAARQARRPSPRSRSTASLTVASSRPIRARWPRCSGAARASPARAAPARSPRLPARAARRIPPCGASTIPATTPCTAPNPSDRRPKTEEDLQLGARACQAVHDGRPDRDRD